jgi:hypothetical protein
MEAETMQVLAGAVAQLVTAGFFAKAVGATIAIFVVVGFVLGFLVARFVYHHRR